MRTTIEKTPFPQQPCHSPAFSFATSIEETTSDSYDEDLLRKEDSLSTETTSTLFESDAFLFSSSDEKDDGRDLSGYAADEDEREGDGPFAREEEVLRCKEKVRAVKKGRTSMTPAPPASEITLIKPQDLPTRRRAQPGATSSKENLDGTGKVKSQYPAFLSKKVLSRPRKGGRWLSIPVLVPVLFSAWVLTLYLSSSQYSNLRGRRQPPKILDLISSSLLLQLSSSEPIKDKTFTILLSGGGDNNKMKRVDWLLSSIQTFSKCKPVKQIVLDNWDADNSLVRDIVSKTSEKLVFNTNDFTTKGVFLIQEGLMLSCNELDRAFNIWTENPERMVGFYALQYNPKKWSPLSMVEPGEGPYQIMTNRAAIFHRAYLPFKLPSATMQYQSLCPDIELSLRITSITNRPPLLVVRQPMTQDDGMLSDTLVQMREREEQRKLREMKKCIRYFMNEFGLTELPSESKTYFGGKRL